MAALIQQIGVGPFARKNRHQHLALRVVLAKVIAESALPVMNCLHKNLLLSLSLTREPDTPLHRTLRLSRLYAAQKVL
jgi:hypothetical protein